MAASEIKPLFGTSTALTITLASLASSTTGVGRQSTFVDNTTTRAGSVTVFYSIKQGTTPTGNKAVYFYLLKGDNNGSPHYDDGAGASDAGWTRQGADQIYAHGNKSSPSTGDVLSGSFRIMGLPPRWAIGVVQDTGAALDSTAGNHFIYYTTDNPEAQ